MRVGSTTFGGRQPKRPSDASAAEETPQQTPEGTTMSGGTSSKGTNSTPGAQQDTFSRDTLLSLVHYNNIRY